VFDRFNGQARRAMLLAFREARRCQHDFLGTEHVLFGLLCDSAGPVVQLVRALGTPPEAVLGQVQELLLDDETTAALERFPLSPAVRRAFEVAGQEAQQLGQQLIGPEHLLLGLLSEQSSEAAIVLGGFGISAASARRQLTQMSPAEKVDHLVQPNGKSAAMTANPLLPEPDAAALATLVAAQVVVDRMGSGGGEVATDVAAPTRGELSRQMRVIETQLRITQLALGSVLGFCVGCLMEDARHALLFAMAGFVLAALRSSWLGAMVGLIAGLMLSTLAPDFDDRFEGTRMLFALCGALAGSLLGNFWRRPLSRLGSDPAPSDESPSSHRQL
jgi:hypothetical protein